jgi:hemerythrin-like domain-containing protein
MKHSQESVPALERRSFVTGIAATLVVALPACAASQKRGGQPAEHAEGESEHEAEVTPGEDLMQEHGLLERILLVYDEAARRVERAEAFDLAALGSAAEIVRSFVEDYHEKNEENHVFPRLQQAGKESELVITLLDQHQRGRKLTDEITRRCKSKADAELAVLLRSFVRMYRPHAAREETVLIPAFRQVIGREGYRELGEQLEEHEHQLFGEHGFEDMVARVHGIERVFALDDLRAFTPP